MSTRGIIRVQFYGKKVDIYKHYDCYPSGVGRLLLEIFTKEDLLEPNKVIKQIVNELRGEVTLYNPIDIEYMYVIDCNKQTIKCYKVNNYTSPVTKKLVKLDR